MELADVTDSKSVGLIIRVGSSPTTGTTKPQFLLGFRAFFTQNRPLYPLCLPLPKSFFQDFSSFISLGITGISGLMEVDLEVDGSSFASSKNPIIAFAEATFEE